MRDQKGFTLVELAISLVVIGLLIGGILKGQELIENSKINATIRDLENIQSAVSMFESAYDYLPGDIPNPRGRIPNCEAALCSTGGNGNWKIFLRSGVSDPEAEAYNFFPHMTKAGFLAAPEGGTLAPTAATRDRWDKLVPTLPLNKSKLYIHYQTSNETWGSTGRILYPGHYFEVLPTTVGSIYSTAPYFAREHYNGRQMFIIDTKMDDGRPQSGLVWGGRCAEGDWSSNQYDMKATCSLKMKARF